MTYNPHTWNMAKQQKGEKRRNNVSRAETITRVILVIQLLEMIEAIFLEPKLRLIQDTAPLVFHTDCY